MDAGRVAQFVELLFRYIEVVPVTEFYPYIERVEEAIGDSDPDLVLYLACVLTRGAGVWSDDFDFSEQDPDPVYSTSEVIDSFDTVQSGRSWSNQNW